MAGWMRRFPRLVLKPSDSPWAFRARSVGLAPLVQGSTALGDWSWRMGAASSDYGNIEAKTGDSLGFVPFEDRFSAKTVYDYARELGGKSDTHVRPEVAASGLSGREALEAQDFLVGLEGLKNAYPLLYAKLELALLVWFERRSCLQPEHAKWLDWLLQLPDANPGSLPFLTPEKAEAFVDLALKEENMGKDEIMSISDVTNELLSGNKILDKFAEALVSECEPLLDVYYRHGLWPPPSSLEAAQSDQRLEDFSSCSFEELYLMDYSLVLAGGFQVKDVPPCADLNETLVENLDFEEFALFPGFEFLSSCSQSPNAQVVLSDANSQLGLALVATEEIRPGEEIRVSRATSGRELLLNSGQVDPKLPF